MKHKRTNPAYQPGINSAAWILAGKCYRERISQENLMRLTGEHRGETSSRLSLLRLDAGRYLREFDYNRFDQVQKLTTRISERLPVRPTIRNVPFYLRQTYTAESNTIVPNTYIPKLEYVKIVKPAEHYEPIKLMINKLRIKRYQIMRQYMDGLVRWPETIDLGKCEFVVTPSFNAFYFKIKAGTDSNKLPTTKRYNDLGLIVHAPREFFDQTFWGLGDHLVVRVLSKYVVDDDTLVIKTLSCDRENLYELDEPTLLKERYYVEKGHQRGTGLTEQAALKSMCYYMGKAISSVLESSHGV